MDISFIIATRNDDHGVNPILRLRFTLQQISLYQWLKLHNVNAEIIIVEWNTIAAKPHVWEYPLIESLLTKIEKDINISISIKFYSVPNYYNDIINCEPVEMYCPFFQYHAKNVGVRRSSGKWKVVMNIDDLLSVKLLQFIGHNLQYSSLNKYGIYLAPKHKTSIWEIYNKFYHNDMKNIQKSTDELNKYENIKLLDTTNKFGDSGAFCEAKVFTNGQINNKKRFPIPATGDFVLIHNDSLYDYYGGGWLEMCWILHIDSEFVARMVFVNKLIPYNMQFHCSYYHIEHLQLSQPISNKSINCDQHQSHGNMYTDIMKEKKIPQHDTLDKIYETQNANWGLKSVLFQCTRYNEQVEICFKANNDTVQ